MSNSPATSLPFRWFDLLQTHMRGDTHHGRCLCSCVSITVSLSFHYRSMKVTVVVFLHPTTCRTLNSALIWPSLGLSPWPLHLSPGSPPLLLPTTTFCSSCILLNPSAWPSRIITTWLWGRFQDICPWLSASSIDFSGDYQLVGVLFSLDLFPLASVSLLRKKSRLPLYSSGCLWDGTIFRWTSTLVK